VMPIVSLCSDRPSASRVSPSTARSRIAWNAAARVGVPSADQIAPGRDRLLDDDEKGTHIMGTPGGAPQVTITTAYCD
jgi:hypothetical protein